MILPTIGIPDASIMRRGGRAVIKNNVVWMLSTWRRDWLIESFDVPPLACQQKKKKKSFFLLYLQGNHS